MTTNHTTTLRHARPPPDPIVLLVFPIVTRDNPLPWTDGGSSRQSPGSWWLVMGSFSVLACLAKVGSGRHANCHFGKDVTQFSTRSRT